MNTTKSEQKSPWSVLLHSMLIAAAALLLVAENAAVAQEAENSADADKAEEPEAGEGHNQEELNVVFNAIRQSLPVPGEIIHMPFADNLDSYGLGTWVVDDETVAGDKAFRAQNANARKNVWDAATVKYLAGRISPRDKVVMLLIARAEELPANADNGKLLASIQESEEPWPTLFKKEIEIGPEWGLHAIAASAKRAFPVGKTQVVFQYGDTAQTIDFGPLFILNLGPEPKLKDVKKALNIN